MAQGKSAATPLSFWLHLATDQTFQMRYITIYVSELQVVPKIQAVKVEWSKKTALLVLKRTFFSIVQLWRLVSLEPLEVLRRNVPHFKGLIYAKVELEAQGCDSTFTICHALVKKAVLHCKMAKGVHIFFHDCKWACIQASNQKNAMWERG